MDSGNSGSLQSSSGGDDQEFESSSSISSFLNPSTHFNSISAPNPPFDFPHQNPTLFDPQYSINNHNDLFWSRGLLRSEPINHPNFGNLATPSQPSSSAHPRAEGGARGGAAPVQPQSNVIKNPKKRTRASRRAPTTVLTTDTTNFRQMVQEFTGIPAAPFSGSPYSRRLDLFLLLFFLPFSSSPFLPNPKQTNKKHPSSQLIHLSRPFFLPPLSWALKPFPSLTKPIIHRSSKLL
ncbi:hypothetical protein CDL12_25413 [Handroanthus impetiginosus]|uniref:VQ domain-containing protein n=1 Tax=Handroanthus impetiginosus TaxID=429701 RepID=A0A2G9GA32_9LAMI|nr:hypothetical protein CDL12_25413 [Handroanthus impetiginosus]